MDPFTVIADPTRRRLLDALLAEPSHVSGLVTATGASQPVVSKHLKILRDAGLVTVETEGQRRLYRVNVFPLQSLGDWLQPYRRYWSARLDALERHLDEANESAWTDQPGRSRTHE